MKKICLTLIYLCAGGLLFAQEDALQDNNSGNSAAAVTGNNAAAVTDNSTAATTEENVVKRYLSVEEAVALAIKNNLSLEASRVGLNAAKRAAQYSWNQFLPVVSVTGSLANANSAGTSFDSGGGTVNNPSLTASGAFSIQWTGLNISLIEGLRQIKTNYEYGLVNLNVAKIQLEENIRKQYLLLNINKENLDVLEDSLRNAEESVASAEKSYRAGLSSELTLLQARVTRDNLIPQLETARDTIKTAQANFAMQIGLPFDTDFEFDPISLENIDLPFDVDALVRQAASGKPDIKALKANIIATKHAVNALRLNQLTPSLSLGWNYNPTATGTPWGKWSDKGGLSLGLTWSLNNLLSFTTQYQNLSTLEDNLRILDINLGQTVLQTQLDIYNTVYTLRQARGSLIAQQKTVELAERTYALTFQAYNAGLQDLISLQTAENNLRQSKAGVLQQEYNFLSAIIDLEYAIGVPFGTLLNNEGNKN